jgi:DNA-binding MarR family transcriptional regulator
MSRSGSGARGKATREALMTALFLEFRQMSTGAIMFHQAIADRLGLHATDHKCADLIMRHGAMTSGRLAELTGLTTGAITGVVDRLESRGLARRATDPQDRRRVIVQLVKNDAVECQMRELFTGIAEGTRAMLDGYSDTELELILDFVRRSNAMSHAEMLKLRASESTALPGKRKTRRTASRQRAR